MGSCISSSVLVTIRRAACGLRRALSAHPPAPSFKWDCGYHGDPHGARDLGDSYFQLSVVPWEVGPSCPQILVRVRESCLLTGS